MAEIRVIFGGIGPNLDGAGQKLDRVLRPLRLNRKHSQKIERIGVVLIGCEGLMQRPLSVREPSGTMMRDRLLDEMLR